MTAGIDVSLDLHDDDEAVRSSSVCVCLCVCAPSPTLSPTDPVPRSQLRPLVSVYVCTDTCGVRAVLVLHIVRSFMRY